MKIEQGQLEGVPLILSPFCNERPEPKQIDLLVIHSISLPPKQYGTPYVEQLFTGTLDPNADPLFAELAQYQVSAHLFIRRTGEIIQFVPFNQRAWHAGVSCYQGRTQCNDFSIGIELEGCDDDPFTSQQYHALANVTQILLDTYPIQDIVGHNEIAPDRKTDPGPQFDWTYYQTLLGDRLILKKDFGNVDHG